MNNRIKAFFHLLDHYFQKFEQIDVWQKNRYLILSYEKAKLEKQTNA